jgi:5-formyltetrahydrofolate cyclo-ligase
LAELEVFQRARTIKVYADAPQRFVVELARAAGKTVIAGDEMALDALPALDLIVVGAVGVMKQGYTLGTGRGDSDLDFAVMRALGQTPPPVVTTVSAEQLLRLFPSYDHDVPVSFIVMPEQTIEVERPGPFPSGVDWERLPRERLEASALLKSLSTRTPAARAASSPKRRVKKSARREREDD